MKAKALLFIWPLLFLTSAAQQQGPETVGTNPPAIARLDTLDANTDQLNKKLAEVVKNGKDLELATKTRGKSPFRDSRIVPGADTGKSLSIDTALVRERVNIFQKIGRWFSRIFG